MDKDRVTHAPSSAANAKQVGGEHYKMDRLEHWDIVWILGLDYYQAQIFKYVMRHERKNGIQDLEKGLHVYEKYIELQKMKASGMSHDEQVKQLLTQALHKKLSGTIVTTATTARHTGAGGIGGGGYGCSASFDDDEADHRRSITSQHGD